MKKIILMVLLNLLMANQPVFGTLKITEIYPAPSTGEQEWVELFNDGDTEISLADYILTDNKDNRLTFETDIASPSSYILATGNNVLNNSGGDSAVIKKSGEIFETVSYTASFSSDKSYVRCDDEWIQTSVITKKDSNTAACISPTPSPTTAPTATTEVIPPTATPTQTMTQSYDHIYLSEVMVNPEEENEWIEMYNDNDFSVSIKNWYIDDAENAGSSPKPLTIDIAAKSYGVFELASSMFNNDTDAVRILDENKNSKDSITYYSSVNGLSLGKNNPAQSSFCITNPTKGYVNGSCVDVSSSSTATPTPKPTATITPVKTISIVPTIKNQTITLSPTPKKIATPKIELPSSLFIGENSSPTTIPKVLGAKTSNSKPKPETASPAIFPAAASLFLSFLTIAKIFFRIKTTLPYE